MPRQWTPEQRKEFGEKMKAKRAAKLAAASNPNPLPTEVIEVAVSKRVSSKVAHPKLKEVVPEKWRVGDIISSIDSIPLESITFDECGLLLNCLSAASTKVATTRRERQEQLDAGSAKSPCATCGRQIDISKPGGFQILTIRDEHFQPKNVFYCSQNCLLARNMPSHRTKKLPGDVGTRA